ncbi:MAG: hypothetical protein H0X41_01000, partial [Chitinophagaceae bacterium]|nr:hypothetical protein [Chitinophagaceae bacterium]
LQPVPQFFSPEYKTQQQTESRLPDFRRLLYWAPDVLTDKEGNARIGFYTSDIGGRFVVEVEGMDNNGNAGAGSCTFEVKRTN